MSDDILKKVKKLLALASSPNEHEARNAAAKAQAIMLKHNLNAQSLRNVNDYINTAAGGVESKISVESEYILSILTKYFFVRTYFAKEFSHYSNTGKRMTKVQVRLVGTETNIEVAQYVFDFLLHTYKYLWKQYKHVNKCPESYRRSFACGLTNGIKHTLETQQKIVETEMGLVVVEDAQLAQWMKSSLNLKERGVRRTGFNSEAYNAGTEQGKKVSIARGINSDSSNDGKLLN